MPRVRRLPSVPFGWYRVTLHAGRGRRLVADTADLETFTAILRATLKRQGAHLHAGCITGQEAHLAVQIGELPVTAFTRSFCHEYARRFNRRHLESGGLFRPHPRVLLIQHRVWLVTLAHVIHWIPRLRPAGGCWWSSDAAYRRHARHDGLITHVVLNILSDGDRRGEAQDGAYRKRFDQPPGDHELAALERGSPEDSRILGEREFVREVLRATRQRSGSRRRRTAFAPRDIERVVVATLERFATICDQWLPARRACEWKRFATLEHLLSHSRRGPLPMIRAMAASDVMANHVATQVQMARYLGCHPKTLSARRLRQFHARLDELMSPPRMPAPRTD